MPRAEGNKSYRTFVKGLITEASPLTYPEDSSYDELNTVLNRKGNRTRRLGLSYAAEGVDNTVTIPDYFNAQNEFVWKAVGNNSNLNFLVFQNGKTIEFYDLDPPALLVPKKSFSINLFDYVKAGTSLEEVEKTLVSFAAGKGFLFIVNENIEPLIIEYLRATDSISVTKISILIRDYDGLNDNLQNDEEPFVLTKEHHYNLQNQGWITGNRSSNTFSPVSFSGYIFNPEVFAINRETYEPQVAYQNSTNDSPIFIFQNKLGRYPGNNKQWWVARAEADDADKGIKAGQFLPDVLDRLYSGNNAAPRGHYILDAFKKDRSAVSGISDIPVEDLQYRPNSVAFFSGRAWYGAGSTVYFSQILDSRGAAKAGLCFQEADPTAEDISDLIATDGGVVPIPEIDKIIKLAPLANGIMVFAMNGVWFISGGDQAFSAVNISISKVSPIGTKYTNSIVETDGVILWWSETGIQALQQSSGQFGPIPGKFGNTSVSEQTIQTFYDEIPQSSKTNVKVCYDTRNNIVMWLYKDKDTTDPSPNYYDSVLLFDLTLQAFYPWKFSKFANGPRITGLFLDIGFSTTADVSEVFANTNEVLTNSLNEVIIGTEITAVKPSSVYFSTFVPSYGRVLSQTTNLSCSDFIEFDNIGLPYESFVETAFELNEDTMRKKQMIYVVSHFTQKENSSCTLETKWEWSNHAHSNKWSTPVEAYRPRLGLNEEYFTVITSKNKVRGSGKAIQFRYGTNSIGKNFDLLGWSVAFVGNTRV